MKGLHLFAAAAAAAAAACAAAPASAHHSGAMFDRNKPTTLVGTLKEVQWTNPHGWIELLVPDAAGKEVQWSVETGGPQGFVRMGFKKDPAYPAPGTKVSVLVYPLRDGRPGASFVSLTLPDGKFFGSATPGQAGSAGGAVPNTPVR